MALAVNVLWVAVLSIMCATLALADVKENAFGNVLFLEKGNQQFFRSSHPSTAREIVFSDEETAAAVAVLLGGLPPDTLSAKSSAKLDSLLSPNPFKRPRTVFMLNIGGVSTDYIQRLTEEASGSSRLRSFSRNSGQEPLELPGESVTLKLLDDRSFEIDVEKFGVSRVVEKLESLVSYLQGSLIRDAKVGSIVLSIPLPDAADFSMSLDLTKTADLYFAVDLISVLSSTELASKLSLAGDRRATLFMGTYNALELIEERSASRTAATKLFLYTAGRVLEQMGEAFDDQLVGVYTLTSSSLRHVPPMFTVSESRYSRLLAEDALAPSPSSPANQSVYDAEIKKLTSRTIVTATIIILILASGLGSIFLFCMRLTRDTLLYANVKLD